MRIVLQGSIKGVPCSLEKMAEKFYKDVIRVCGIRKTLSDLRDISSEPSKSFYNNLLKHGELKNIITAKPQDFNAIILRYKKYEPIFKNQGYQSIVNAMGYYKFRESSLSVNVVEQLGLKVCPYCNHSFILTRKKSRRVDCEYDHYKPKSKYPYLSISFFNLIPCCPICNRKKTSKSFNLDELSNTFHTDLSTMFHFESDKKSVIDYIVNGNRDFNKIKIKLKSNQGKYTKMVNMHNERFHLLELHQLHKDIVFEIYSKRYIYPKDRRDLMMKNYGFLFSEEELDRFVLGNYILPEDINKRPLAKFMQDIAKEASEIN